ncbi:MAG: AzlC family ABC transporter permease [Oscillospiraceae bacterium]|nr:MAG: AzlC family ABC transporter permease [Oscillospiraceae bacterium]
MVKKTVLQTYSFREGLRDGLPIALGYLTVAFGFGLTAVQAGLYPLTALILSLINETSAGQTAGLSVIAAHGTLIEMALTQFIINLRYSLMAISLSQRVDASFTVPARLFLGFSITDEIFAVASTKHDPVGTRYFFRHCPPALLRVGGRHADRCAGGCLPAPAGQPAHGHHAVRDVFCHHSAACAPGAGRAGGGADRGCVCLPLPLPAGTEPCRQWVCRDYQRRCGGIGGGVAVPRPARAGA